MFSFLQDFGNYEERKVARFDKDNLSVSTARVSDSTKPFETAVMHPQYHEGKWVIVELYDTKAEAQLGHEKWVKLMTTNPLDKLTDASDNEISQFAEQVGAALDREFPRLEG